MSVAHIRARSHGAAYVVLLQLAAADVSERKSESFFFDKIARRFQTKRVRSICANIRSSNHACTSNGIKATPQADDELVVACYDAQSTHIVRHYGNGQFAQGNTRYNVVLIIMRNSTS